MRRGKVAAELFQPAQGLAVGAVMGAIVRYLSGLVRFLGVPSAAAFGLALLAWPAFADVPDDKRVALVIGNGAYENAPKLDNAAFDAKAVADAFRKLGFEVVDGYDLGIAEMRAKVSEFAAALPDAKSAVIYYAGHGISVDEENYLIPTDIVLKNPTDLDLGSISVLLLLKQMKREERVNIVVLDACRDNPFASALASAKTRAIVGEQGLSRIDGDLARGTLIAFASDPKSTALDGPPGHHSPFTEAFLAHVFDPGVSIDTVMSRVRAEVWEKTRHKQLPLGQHFAHRRIRAQPAAFARKSGGGRKGRARGDCLRRRPAVPGRPALGIRPAFESERRLPSLSRRLPERRVRRDGEEPDRESPGRRRAGRRSTSGKDRDGRTRRSVTERLEGGNRNRGH